MGTIFDRVNDPKQELPHAHATQWGSANAAVAPGRVAKGG